jgi:hypothetical protein
LKTTAPTRASRHLAAEPASRIGSEWFAHLRGYDKWTSAVAMVQSATLSRVGEVGNGKSNPSVALGWESSCEIRWEDQNQIEHTAVFQAFEESPLLPIMRGRHGQYPVQSRKAVRVLSARFDPIRIYSNVEIDGLGAAAPRARHRVHRVPACTLGFSKCFCCKSGLSPGNATLQAKQETL